MNLEKSYLIIALYDHRVLGYMLAPFMGSHLTGKDYIQLHERITLSNIEKFRAQLNPDEIKLIKIIEEYSDSQLVRIFSRKATSSPQFLASLDKSTIQDHIRPYIERRMLKSIDIIADNEIPVYFKEGSNNIYESEHITLVAENVESVFHFKRVNGELSYNLTIGVGDKEIKLTGKSGILLVHEPCRIVVDNVLYLFSDIDGKKLSPFFQKEYIHVPQRAEKKFLETFVINVIRNFKVNTDAFTIKDINQRPAPILSIDRDLTGLPVFLLRFRYGEKGIYYAGKKTELTVTYNHEQGTFYRMNRDYANENSVVFNLLEMGLKNITDAWFHPLKLLRADDLLIYYELVSWLNQNADELDQAGILVEQGTQYEGFYLKKFHLEINVQEAEHDWFDLNITVKFEEFEIPFIKFRGHILEGRREYSLPDGKKAILPLEWFSRFRDVFAFARVTNNRLSLEKKHYSLLQEGLKGLKDSYSRKIKLWLEQQNDTRCELPEGVTVTLRPYQEEGYGWMVRLYENGFGGCLADDMGLGKTLQTLTMLKKAIEKEAAKSYGDPKKPMEGQLTIFDLMQPEEARKARPSLIVVPKSLVHNWINEVRKFVPSLRIGAYSGMNRKPLKHYYDSADLIVTSYGLIRNDIDEFKHYSFLYIVLDESQVIKNPSSKTYKALLQLNATSRLVLTGTPIENSLTDLWSQMNFVNPGLLGSLPFFKSEFVTPIERTQDQVQSQKLHTLIKPFIMRRKKQEVAKELPDLCEQVILCDMTDMQESYYESEKSKARNLILQSITQSGIKKSSFVILQSLTKLRQVANHPKLVDKEYQNGSGKFEEVTRNLQNVVDEGHKALLFSSFVKHLDLYTSYCIDNDIPYLLLTGETTDREKVVTRFQQDEKIRLMLISIKAGGYGLNLTAADYVFILDPWWNPAVEQQALSRAHRIGQKNNVFVYRFISKDSIEEKMLNLQQRKSVLAEAFINTNNPFSAADEEEIMELIG